MSIARALDELVAKLPPKIDLSLDRVCDALSILGEPQKRLPPVIHVAGTNGKGSTIAFLRAILEAAGLRVHVFSSPHLVRFEERVRLAGKLVDEETMLKAFQRVAEVLGQHPMTAFEMITVTALKLFSEHPADVLLLEVGMGGRLDATNVIECPLCTIITPIGLDHQAFLGNTVEKIAAEKAGILKKNCPAVSAPQAFEAREVIDRIGQRLGVRVSFGDEDWTVSEENGRLIYQDENGLLDLPLPRLSGRHQWINAGTAIAALRKTSLLLPEQSFADGIKTARWQARLQKLKNGMLLHHTAEFHELWLDGAHNEDGARVAADFFADLEEQAPKPLHIIVGMLTTKDSKAFLRYFDGLAQMVWAIPITDEPLARDPQELAKIAVDIGLSAMACPSIIHALQSIRNLQRTPCRILITGSLYLAGDILRQNETWPD